jgi:RNA polymerase sigma factor (sigma-70 family)
MRSADDSCNPERLVELVRRADPTALDQLTRCYGERLLAAGRRHCRTFSEAEDAVQDALVVAATELDGFRGEGSLEGWLIRIVASACRRMSRGRKNDAARHDSDVTLEAGGVTPEVAASQQELGSVLERALLELDPLDRAVLILAELEDWSAPEIGREFGFSAGAIRTRLTRARARVRELVRPLLGGAP